MLDINKLLKKKGWTGRELGKLALLDLAQTFEAAVLTGKQQRSPVSTADIQKLIRTLETEEDHRIYSGYVELRSWVNFFVQIAIAQEQQAMLRFTQLATFVQNAFTAESISNYVKKLPVVMTEKQYSDTVSKHLEDDNDKDVTALFFMALDFHLKALKSNPRAKNPLKPLKKKLQAELVQDSQILDYYNHVKGLCYYTKEDGTKSEKLDYAGWAKAAFPQKELSEKELDERLFEAAKTLYETGEMPTPKHLKPRYDKHTWEERPEGITKWEIVEEGSLGNFYNYNIFETAEDKEESSDKSTPQKEEPEEGEDPVTLCKALKAEYPELVQAILKDMGERYPDLIPLQSLPVEKWPTTLFRPEELCKLDFYGYKKQRIEDYSVFEENGQALVHGVAILRPQDSRLPDYEEVDSETGYYKAPDIKPLLIDISLEGFFPESEKGELNTHRAQNARALMLQSMIAVRAYNTCLELIVSNFGVKELLVMRRPMEELESKIEAFNHMVHLLYRAVYTNYDDEKLKERKFKVIKEVLYPIDLGLLTVPKQRLDKVKTMTKSPSAFALEGEEDPFLILSGFEPGEGQQEEQDANKDDSED
jgi:hypothetical protein